VIATVGHGESAPPRFLRLAGHPLRWRLLSELARSDRRVGELCELADRRQSLVSYHLRQLRDGGLVSMRRSAADGRDTYYVLDLARCGELLSSAGVSLHPGLAPPPRARRERRSALARVLFLCTGNSARSQIAEALCEQLSGGAVSAASAGSHPKPLHPNAVRVMRERGIDLAGCRSKHLSEFSRRRFDYVISLCDHRRTRADPLERPRPRARTRKRRGNRARVRAHRRRTIQAHRVSHRSNRIDHHHGGGHRACLTSS
jgi:protein-tyrosine-phosphatase/DNA-binding transcriptional ArsR family regulator